MLCFEVLFCAFPVRTPIGEILEIDDTYGTSACFVLSDFRIPMLHNFWIVLGIGFGSMLDPCSNHFRIFFRSRLFDLGSKLTPRSLHGCPPFGYFSAGCPYGFPGVALAPFWFHLGRFGHHLLFPSGPITDPAQLSCSFRLVPFTLSDCFEWIRFSQKDLQCIP